jgi:hypothetical protein
MRGSGPANCKRAARSSVGWLSGAVLFALAHGCGSLPCEETLTCPPPPDGAPEGGAGDTGGMGGTGGKTASGGISTAGSSGTGGSSAAAATGGHGAASSGAGGTSPEAGETGSSGAGAGATDECEQVCDDGNPANGEESCLRGHCIPGNAPPYVQSITPSNGKTGADPGGTIRITFSEELDPTTVSVQSIAVMDGESPIAGNVSYAGRLATFTPGADLGLLGHYTVVVNSTVADLEGRAMLDDFTSTFDVRDGAWAQATAASTTVSTLAGLSADDEGRFTVGFAGDVPYARHYESGAWSSQTQVSCEHCFRYVLSGNTHGDAVTAGIDLDGSAMARQYRNGIWQTQDASVAELTGYLPQTAVSAAVAPSGEAYVILIDDDMLRTRQTDSGGFWSGTTDTAISETVYGTPLMAFDETGDGFAAWIGSDTETGSDAVRFMQLHAGDVGSIQTISSSLTGESLSQLSIAVAADGDAMALWLTTDGVMASNYTKSGWNVAKPVKGSEGVVTCGPTNLVFDGEDFVAAWQRYAGDATTPCLVYTSRWHKGVWADAELRSEAGKSAGQDAPPLLGTDAHGNLMLLWIVGNEATHARFNRGTNTWSTPKKAFDSRVTSPRALAVAPGGTLIMAFNSDSSVYTALFQ